MLHLCGMCIFNLTNLTFLHMCKYTATECIIQCCVSPSSTSSPTPFASRFSPEQLGITASSLLAWLLVEVVLIWLCLYLMAVNSQLRWLDLLAFSGYKYVCMIVSLACGLLLGNYGYLAALAFTSLTIAYFLVSVNVLHFEVLLGLFCCYFFRSGWGLFLFCFFSLVNLFILHYQVYLSSH